MRFLTLLYIMIIVGLPFKSHAAGPSKSHSHEGRVHTHQLPSTGVKHFHKHAHNGRSHIHPYSAKIGFNHSHNKSPRAKAWANAVKHEHGGRPHSHPLPRSGVKHQHSHRHGGRTHLHPLPVSGVKHFHQINKRKPNSRPSANPPMIRGLSIKQQIAEVMKFPLPKQSEVKQNQNKRIARKQTLTTKNPQSKINLRDKKYKAILKRSSENARQNRAKTIKRNPQTFNKNTIKKVMGYHQHDGRSHQHLLPKTGKKHYHKHAHAGRTHFHPTPISNTAHKHKKVGSVAIVKPVVKLIVKQAKKVVPKRLPQRKVVRGVNKRPIKRPTVAANRKLHNLAMKPVKKISRSRKQTPKQKAEADRQFNLALRYENGTGVKKNLPQAVNWYLRSAKNGNAKAQFNLASMYEHGDGVARNMQQAMQWYKTAANNGDANAQVNLGNRYAKGTSVPKNIQEAAKWYKRAADQGDMRGRANLNYLIEDNNGAIRR